jgi:hypothetical protein
MAYQLRGFVMRLAMNVNLPRLVALGLTLGAIFGPLYSGGGGGSGA